MPDEGRNLEPVRGHAERRVSVEVGFRLSGGTYGGWGFAALAAEAATRTATRGAGAGIALVAIHALRTPPSGEPLSSIDRRQA